MTFTVDRVPLVGNRLTIKALDIESNSIFILALPGIEVISFKKVCLTKDKLLLACGSKAKVALSNFLAYSTMSCQMEKTAGRPMEPVACQTKGEDIGEWVVRNGIGRPAQGDKYTSAVIEARERGMGMWVDVAANSSAPLFASR